MLLINDQSSGVGVILDKSRLQGVIKGTAAGEVILEKVMTDEQVSPGDLIVTSGGDQIFPKGITVGTVMKVSPGADLFLNIRVKPSASLSRLEEVLVITKKEDRPPSVAETQFSARGGHSDPAAAFGTGQAGSGRDSGTRHRKAGGTRPETAEAGERKHSSGNFDGASGAKPATSQTAVPPKKASQTAKPAASATVRQPASQPASPQPGTGDQPH